MNQICGKIVPRQNQVVGNREDGYLAECVLEKDHIGHHVIRTSEGECFGWKDDDDCDCCGPEEPDPCYVYWSIDPKTIPKVS